MSHERITDSELEEMCQDICLNLGKTQYGESWLKHDRYKDVITTYKDGNFTIIRKDGRDSGSFYLEVYYKGTKVLDSEFVGDEDFDPEIDELERKIRNRRIEVNRNSEKWLGGWMGELAKIYNKNRTKDGRALQSGGSFWIWKI